MGALALTGCIRDQIFQPIRVSKADVAFAPPPTVAVGVKRTVPGNVATVEFNNQGNLADSCSPSGKYKCQLEYAKDFIAEARRQAGKDQLVVLTFIHGNRNDASDIYSDNFQHFQPLIDCLNVGQAGYHATSYSKPVDCTGIDTPKHVRYVGIYIGWRGRTNKPGIDLRQYSAMKLGKKPDIVNVLYALRNAAKDSPTRNPARFVVVGHSFGALILEQAEIQIFYKAYDPKDPNHVTNIGSCTTTAGPAQGYKPFTDLVVTLNASVNAVPAKHLIEFMESQSKQFCHSDKLAPDLDRPLLIAIHADSDRFTGKTGSYLRYIYPSPGGFHPGRFTLRPASEKAPHSYTVVHSSPANLTYFDSLCYVDKGNDYPNSRTGNQLCDQVAAISDRDPSHGLAFTLSKPLTSPLGHLYVRHDYNCKAASGNDKNDPRPTCGAGPMADANLNLLTWNRSPYWLLNVPDTVISGHDDFWTPTLIGLLSDMAVTFDVLKHEDVIQ
jgi:pimeloyl-ACP methyl ester carboxylesterase